MKIYFVLSNSAGCELDRHEADSSYPDDDAADYAGQMTRWLKESGTVLSAGDTIKIEEVE